MKEDKIIRFVSKAELERERMIQEARAIYESIFPTTHTIDIKKVDWDEREYIREGRAC